MNAQDKLSKHLERFERLNNPSGFAIHQSVVSKLESGMKPVRSATQMSLNHASKSIHTVQSIQPIVELTTSPVFQAAKNAQAIMDMFFPQLESKQPPKSIFNGTKMSIWQSVQEVKSLDARIADLKSWEDILGKPNRFESIKIDEVFGGIEFSSATDIPRDEFVLSTEALEEIKVSVDELVSCLRLPEPDELIDWNKIRGRLKAKVASLVRGLIRTRTFVIRSIHLVCRRVDVRSGIRKFLKFLIYSHESGEEEINVNCSDSKTYNTLILIESEKNRKDTVYRFAA